MPATPTYPGVYIEEIPSGVRTITGVATSIAAFVDFFKRGTMNKAVQIFNMGDAEREFGGLDKRSEGSYAIQQFFLNGGTEAWVVRTASGDFKAANVDILDEGGGAALTVEAINPGTWGDALQVSIDYPTPISGSLFNMTVLLTEKQNGETRVVRSEVFRGLSMNPADSNFVSSVVNDKFSGSKLVRITAQGSSRPRQTGTLSGTLDPFPTLTESEPQLAVNIGSETATAKIPTDKLPLTSLAQARGALETAIRAAKPGSRAFAEASVTIVDNRLRILAGPTEANLMVSFAAAGTDPTVAILGLSTATTVEGLLSGDLAAGALPPTNNTLEVTIGGIGPIAVALDDTIMVDLDAARGELEAELRAADSSAEFAGARVVAYSESGEERLVVLAGVPGVPLTFGGAAAPDLGLDAGVATSVQALVSAAIDPIPNIAANSAVNVQIGGEGPHTATLAAASTLTDIATALQNAIRAASTNSTFTGAHVFTNTLDTEDYLIVLAGTTGDIVTFSASPADSTTMAQLQLNTPATLVNVQVYALGGGTVLNSAQAGGAAGDDGIPPDANALIGDLVTKSGMHALEDVDLFNILCIPRTALVSGPDALDADPVTAGAAAAAVMTAAINYCEKRRAFFVVDTPNNIDEVQEVKEWLDANPLPRKNAALYFPRVQIPDPLNSFRLRSVGASGTIAGLYARTDGTRGVWKAPAGTEATLTNVQQLDYLLSDSQNGTLNPLAINCLRTFPVYGTVSWGARTRVGADQMASEWKYIPVRRLALFLEESLYRGTQWVVFEPNDEPLWAQIRLNIGAFMHNLFRQGAFQGKTPREAYFVKCDHETTTQNDINLGVVNIVVGFAPLKPAEFVIIKIQQIAGQIQV